jgi:hypothetical protein
MSPIGSWAGRRGDVVGDDALEQIHGGDLSRCGEAQGPGGWKWTPLGASSQYEAPGIRRHVDGVAPYARANARVNASWEE